ncbi:hypothetical protein BDZ89DRAFT_1176189, partial [Hymenopellis radicata]
DNILTTQRLDPILSPGNVATHVHSGEHVDRALRLRCILILGGSNFSINLTTTAELRESGCTSIPVQEDKSNYWYPHLYFQKNDGSFIAANGSAVMYGQYYYYLFSDNSSVTTPFPDDFRMISGDPDLRTLNASSFAQQAVTFLCLNFDGESPRTNELPVDQDCPSGIRAQVNFPSCWDGVNVDSDDHKSHVAFPSTGPDNGTCEDAGYPITLPRIFLEVYWITSVFSAMRSEAMTPSQPFVFANGDPTGYGYHADFFNGWEPGVLQKAINVCNCNPYGDPTCCVAAGAFTMDSKKQCYISNTVDEQALGNLSVLPGANPVQAPCFETYYPDFTPSLLDPVYVGQTAPNKTGEIVRVATTINVAQTAKETCIRKGAAERPTLGWTFLIVHVSSIWYFLYVV